MCVEGVPIALLRHHQGVNVGDAETHEDTDSDVSVHAPVASFLWLFLYIKGLDAVFLPEPIHQPSEFWCLTFIYLQITPAYPETRAL